MAVFVVIFFNIRNSENETLYDTNIIIVVSNISNTGVHFSPLFPPYIVYNLVSTAIITLLIERK